MIPLSPYSAMRIPGSSLEELVIFMTSREVNTLQRNGDGVYCIIMMDVSSKIRRSCSSFLIALNDMKTTNRVVISLPVTNFLDKTLLPLRRSRNIWNLVMIVTYKCFVTIHATLRAVTTTGGQRQANLKVGFNITF